MTPATAHAASRAVRPSRHGFALSEVLVVLALFSLVAAAIHAVLSAQQRFYAQQAQVAGTRDAARIAVDVLSGELRAASPSRGDLYAVANDSVSLRSTTGIGTICSVDGSTVHLLSITGFFGDSRADSALLFVEGDAAGWSAAHIQSSRSAASGTCPDGRSPDIRLALDRELEGVAIGSPVQAFRPYTYRLYLGSDGRWWLGQRLRSGRLQPITGPFAAPGAGGLRLTYRDSLGAPVLSPGSVVEVQLSVAAQSSLRFRRSGWTGYFTDTLSVRVYLRNS
jgi:prepilin-type N-terminal cleavage/methylation domain-containing protein